MTVALVGARGAGKTTVGRALAQALARDFVDLDDEVERLAGATVAEVLTSHGEDAFRALEARALLAVFDRAPRRSSPPAAARPRARPRARSCARAPRP